jgi:hypothetical protein
MYQTLIAIEAEGTRQDIHELWHKIYQHQKYLTSLECNAEPLDFATLKCQFSVPDRLLYALLYMLEQIEKET